MYYLKLHKIGGLSTWIKACCTVMEKDLLSHSLVHSLGSVEHLFLSQGVSWDDADALKYFWVSQSFKAIQRALRII